MPLSKARDRQRHQAARVARRETEAEIKGQLETALIRRGITADQLLDEWAAIAAGQVSEPLNWASKVKALSEISARLWPVPRPEPERPGVVNNTLVLLNGFTLEQLRALLGRME